MSPKTTALLAGLTGLALAACILPPSYFERDLWGPAGSQWQDQGRYRQASETAEEPPPAVENPSYDPGAATTLAEDAASAEVPPPQPCPPQSWDGGLVEGAPQGRVVAQEGPLRSIEAPSVGRTHIIELYQRAVDERDALAARLELVQRGADETRIALEARNKETGELAARVAALENAHAQALSENQALAARLVQAQIRRLEAEKLLLEARIEAERVKAAQSARAAEGRPAAGKPAPGKSSSPAKGGERNQE